MKYYGQFNPPQDQVLFETYFRDGAAGVYMECGAFDGITESSCFFFEESLGWSGINIEPVPFVFERLRVNRPKAYNVHAALSDHAGEAQFSHAIHPIHGAWFGNGSLAHSRSHRKDLDAQGCRYESFNVPLITYREVLRNSGLTRLDLFVLDVEGHELEAIAGMQGADVLPRVFCVEYGMVDLAQLDSTLSALGYRRDRVVHNNMVYLRSAA
jgi:FkbM family methyltransferase